MRKLKPKYDEWYQTFTGRKFNPLIATPGEIRIEDIAHALSNICRYGGHCLKFYSVAQHSVLCAIHAPEGHKFQALMHDATEAYIGDMVFPLKNQIPSFGRLEDDLWKVIAERYDLPAVMSPEVKKVDRQALGAEKRDLLDNRLGYHWKLLDGYEIWPEEIVPWPPHVAEKRFMMWFKKLYTEHLKTIQPNDCTGPY